MEFLKKQWDHSSIADSEKVRHLCHEWKMHPLVADILLSRGFKTHKDIQSFLEPSMNNLRDPFQLRHMHFAVELLQDTIVNDRQIIILGDYDVDGITATALVLDFLRVCGAEKVDYFIPVSYTHLTLPTSDLV